MKLGPEDVKELTRPETTDVFHLTFTTGDYVPCQQYEITSMEQFNIVLGFYQYVFEPLLCIQ